MFQESSPEERLLKLIRRKNKPAPASASGAVVSERVKPFTRVASEKSIEIILKKTFSPEIFSLRKFKVVLICAVVFSLCYLAFELLFFKEGNAEKIKATEKVNVNAQIKESSQEQALPFDYYANQINKRDIFRPIGQEQAGGVTAERSALGDLAAGLKLTGIIVDKEPQAIIEDTKQKKTYFLFKGDYIGEIKVEDIQESKVILSYSGERLELVP